MIPYYGLPITPETAAVVALQAGHAFPSFSDSRNMALIVAVCQSFAVDNGAYSAWKAGRPITDWTPFYKWAAACARIPSCDFVVVPDVIDGDEAANDALLADCPLSPWIGAPVWHLHESFDRLERLALVYPRICFGSSGEFAKLKTPAWWDRINQAMRVVCNDDGEPLVKLHGLRMLDPAIFTQMPFSSADSTNIARNIGIDKRWKNGNYLPPTKEARAAVMRARVESHNAPARWVINNEGLT